jgi:hypothetical protein
METKLIAMILGVALVLATAMSAMTVAIVVNTISQVHAVGDTGGIKGIRGEALSHAGVTDGQTAHGLATACSHPNVAEHHPNCISVLPPLSGNH